MCPNDTVTAPGSPARRRWWVRRATYGIALMALAVGPVVAQETGPRWRAVGGELRPVGLVGAAGGSALEVRTGIAGGTVGVRLANGSWWGSDDGGETWQRSEAPRVTSALESRPVVLEGKYLRALAPSGRRGRWYALGEDLWLSPDDGGAWINLTAAGGASVIGDGQQSLAFDAGDPDTVFVANRRGLWRSRDGGWTWVSLNANLPNFPRVLLVDAGARDRPASIAVPAWDGAKFEARAGSWSRAAEEASSATDGVAERATDASGETRELVRLARFGAEDGGAYAVDGGGMLWGRRNSEDGWAREFAVPEGGRVTALAPAGRRGAAVALANTPGGQAIWRKAEAGGAWDDISADLPADGGWRTVLVGPAGSVFVAGEAGVYWSVQRFDAPAAAADWERLTGTLPAAAVYGLALDERSGRLLAAVEGFGVFETDSPAIGATLRAWNAADGTRRAAAPGGLLTLAGTGIERVGSGTVAAPVLAQTGREAQIQVPFEAQGNQLGLRVELGDREESLRYPLEAVSPAIFVEDGEAIVMDGGTGEMLDASRPAEAGREILVLCTGLGAVNPRWPTGVPAPMQSPPAVTAPVRATWAGVELTVIEATLAPGYIGSYLVRVALPAGLVGGAGDLRLVVGGRESNAAGLFVVGSGL